MKPIRWRFDAALAPLSLTLMLAVSVSFSACDSGGPRTAENERAARAAAETTRAAGAIAAVTPSNAGQQAAGVRAPAAQADSAAVVPPPAQSDDALITAKVTTGLAIDRTLRSMHIDVATRAGVVTLKGPAPSPAARARAEEIARNVQGVTAVENGLRVAPG